MFIASSVLVMVQTFRQVTRENADVIAASLVAVPCVVIGVMMVLNLPTVTEIAKA